MQNVAVLSRTYPARISAVEALIQAVQTRTNNAANLRDAASELDRAGPLYGRASTAVVYAAFAELLRTVAMLVEWRAAVLNADVDADRFLRGAKARHQLWVTEYSGTDAITRLLEAASDVDKIDSIENVGAVCRSVACTPLPIGVFAEAQVGSRLLGRNEERTEEMDDPPELAVAFLRFVIDGVPADETHFLSPGDAHDLEIEVRVSRWPDSADSLSLSPVTIEPKSNYDFPVFQFTRPSGDPPFRMLQRGRAVLKVPQSLQARPFEFRYTASFSPIATEQPIAVVGQRTLRIEGFDLRQAPITGYAGIDRKLIQVRDLLRGRPLITAVELSDVLTVLTPLASLAGRALQDALFRRTCSEADFQADVRNELRRIPAIGSELEEHPRAAGGITDLSFHGIRIELKYGYFKSGVGNAAYEACGLKAEKSSFPAMRNSTVRMVLKLAYPR
ncbi:hypothetical protein, partial [Paraburkholderia elongata]|uniref:hypothetical protein n=1 Tax=Paraburkholderia elongata TaxID=2675747 RepID=UPI0015532019